MTTTAQWTICGLKRERTKINQQQKRCRRGVPAICGGDVSGTLQDIDLIMDIPVS